MLMKRKAKMLAVGAAALFGTVAATGTAHADDVEIVRLNSSGVQMSHAESYGDNGAVKVCDDLADGYGASVQYVRVVSSGPATVWAESGAPDCNSSSNIVSNPVAAFRLCQDVPGDDICGAWRSTGRS
jgi:hypothetical protein